MDATSLEGNTYRLDPRSLFGCQEDYDERPSFGQAHWKDVVFPAQQPVAGKLEKERQKPVI
jgi:hypothetical protein